MREKVILVIDDDEMNLQIAKMVLERKLKCKVIGADNGVEGIDILKAQRVSLVLLDVMMPDFDGIETLQEIRNDPLIKNVPVMMLTATVDLDTVKKAGMLGVRDYIKKPFLPADLVTRVEKKLAEEKPSVEILLIGDDAKALQGMKKIIEENFNHEALIAASYDDATKILGDTEVNLIIACADMKFIDGFKILAFLAADKKFKAIPFAVTSSDKLLELIDKLNPPEFEELSELEEIAEVEEPPEVEEIAEEEETPKAKSVPDKKPLKPPVEEKKPVVKEVAEAPVAQKEKKKLGNVVTNLIGYELDLKI